MISTCFLGDSTSSEMMSLESDFIDPETDERLEDDAFICTLFFLGGRGCGLGVEPLDDGCFRLNYLEL